MKLISFCKTLLLGSCVATVCTSINAQDKVMKKLDSPINVDLWQNGLPNTNGMEAQGYDDKKIISSLVSGYIFLKNNNRQRLL